MSWGWTSSQKSYISFSSEGHGFGPTADQHSLAVPLTEKVGGARLLGLVVALARRLASIGAGIVVRREHVVGVIRHAGLDAVVLPEVMHLRLINGARVRPDSGPASLAVPLTEKVGGARLPRSCRRPRTSPRILPCRDSREEEHGVGWSAS